MNSLFQHQREVQQILILTFYNIHPRTDLLHIYNSTAQGECPASLHINQR